MIKVDARVQLMNIGNALVHGFSITNGHGAPGATLSYADPEDAEAGRQHIVAALEKVITATFHKLQA